MALSDCPIGPAAAVSDPDRAREFYEGKLGLTGKPMGDDGSRLYSCGNGTSLVVYVSKENAGTNKATLAGWEVPDVEAAVAELGANGVEFEQYDQPGLKTDERGIVSFDGAAVAFFKDPDGNIFSINSGM